MEENETALQGDGDGAWGYTKKLVYVRKKWGKIGRQLNPLILHLNADREVSKK